jgi:hypothetical protein
MAWGLLGLVLGAGGMYVLGKEEVWKPNPVAEGPMLWHTYEFRGYVDGTRQGVKHGDYEFDDGTSLSVKRDRHITGTAKGRTFEEALNSALENLGLLGFAEITVTSSKVIATDKIY